jgi:hypothetical protein
VDQQRRPRRKKMQYERWSSNISPHGRDVGGERLARIREILLVACKLHWPPVSVKFLYETPFKILFYLYMKTNTGHEETRSFKILFLIRGMRVVGGLNPKSTFWF